MQNLPYPVKVKLTGTDGNAFALMGQVTDALARYLRGETDLTASEIQAVKDQFIEEATSGDYDHLLRTCCKWVEVA